MQAVATSLLEELRPVAQRLANQWGIEPLERAVLTALLEAASAGLREASDLMHSKVDCPMWAPHQGFIRAATRELEQASALVHAATLTLPTPARPEPGNA